MEGTTLSRGGGTSIMNDVWDLASQVNRTGFTMPWRLYTNEYWSPTQVKNATHGLKYTKSLSSNSYFDLLMKIDTKKYITGHGARRIQHKVILFLDLVMMNGLLMKLQ